MLPDLWLSSIVSGLLGLLIGSFLNVCIYRLPRDLSVVTPRSFCPGCEKRIAWYDNIPVLSYTLLRAQCRHCRQPIRRRYVVVEVITALVFACAVWRFGLSPESGKVALFEAILIVLFWTDLEERLLPDELTLGGSLAGLALAWFVPEPNLLGQLVLSGASARAQSITDSAVGGLVLAASLWLLAWVVTKVRMRAALQFKQSTLAPLKNWSEVVLADALDTGDDGYGGAVLGLGDVKLLVLTGTFLGLEGGLLGLLLGSLVGSILGIAYLRFTGKNPANYRLPFGSFLCVGAGVAAFLPVRF